MIQVKNISVSLGKNEVLHNVSCNFEKGKITGIMGRNGSGKTVLLKSICGLVIPDSGEIAINNKLLTQKNSHNFSMGSLIETPGFLREYSGYKNLSFLASLTCSDANERVKKVMEIVGLDYRSKKKVGAYSLGMRQRLAIAQALLDDPDILILDEPMNGLDQKCIDETRKMLKEYSKLGKTIVIASHYKEDLKLLCDKIYQMESGRILQDN